ncbi:MAG: MFS transporter [Alphaproteobacteria bacterium]|nr:MFS transporter [Alphaproteobacteria bacterium]
MAPTALTIYAVSFGAPVITVVALKPIAAELGSARSVPALAYSLAWLGSAVGGIAMGRLAERIGVRWTVIFGALMIGTGLAVSSGGGRIGLFVGHGVFIGLLGNAGINAPLYIYVSQWFDRRRGTALALISSGQYVAGAIWPPLFEREIDAFGWRHTMLIYAAVEILAIVPAAALVFGPAPEALRGPGAASGPVAGARVLGLPADLALGLLCLAAFLCCVPMAMPQGHLVAFCSDIGIPAAQGAEMLSLLLGCAFVSRQFWGVVADRIGGLRTILAGSACQLGAMLGFLLTQDEAGLFLVAAAFGLGFSGIIPAYVLAVRELFPAAEASWRIPTVLLCSGSGMAAGGWLAGVIFDYAGFYGAAFAAGILFNAFHLVVIGTLVWRQRRRAPGRDASRPDAARAPA